MPQKTRHEGMVVTDTRDEVKEPPMYKVILHNDDYTTMEFVIMVLEVVFHLGPEQAMTIMLNVHQQGRGIAGIYTRDEAETKMAIVHQMARQHDHPLKCSIEKT
ncbi:MAG: ATP-dependent Clp protease adapter ClpS [Proteobacteria bacterium]|nr:ATP-dependent Clp protease adapter ClpS [Pseudomonadota bacterium]MBU1687396.1 ATP-dependent Clp protease adapter ClpS [Pseudomonadota bacterium]